jgi:hypothetical protein
VQARKGFVALQTPRRKFAVIKAATRSRVDLGLRIRPPGGSRFTATDPGRSNDMASKVALATVADVDDEVRTALSQAYADNA